MYKYTSKDFLAWYKENWYEYQKIKHDFRVRKMTRAASQTGDTDSSQTPGLNSSVQTLMNDYRVRYYVCLNESASVIPYFISAVK